MGEDGDSIVLYRGLIYLGMGISRSMAEGWRSTMGAVSDVAIIDDSLADSGVRLDSVVAERWAGKREVKNTHTDR
jgi:hypothetical protein